MKMSRKKTALVISKTDGKCWYCGCDLSDGWSVDHQMPRSRGGDSGADNLVPCCGSCNSSKKDKTLGEFRKQEQFRLTTPSGMKCKPFDPLQITCLRLGMGPVAFCALFPEKKFYGEGDDE